MNTTDSAVRLTHMPTGIVVTCQNEKSQLQNKEAAFKVLRAKLYELERRKREEELSALRGERMENSFGSQIRNYVLYPYQMVKDLRSNIETGNVDAVLDGDIRTVRHRIPSLACLAIKRYRLSLIRKENDVNLEDLKGKANDIRVDIVEMVAEAGSGHPGGRFRLSRFCARAVFRWRAHHEPERSREGGPRPFPLRRDMRLPCFTQRLPSPAISPKRS